MSDVFDILAVILGYIPSKILSQLDGNYYHYCDCATSDFDVTIKMTLNLQPIGMPASLRLEPVNSLIVVAQVSVQYDHYLF